MYSRAVKFQTLAYFIILALVVLSFTLLVNLLGTVKAATDRNYRTGRSNNAYVRVVACVASVSPTKRTPEYVKGCYDQAEKANNNTIDRYGDGE